MDPEIPGPPPVTLMPDELEFGHSLPLILPGALLGLCGVMGLLATPQALIHSTWWLPVVSLLLVGLGLILATWRRRWLVIDFAEGRVLRQEGKTRRAVCGMHQLKVAVRAEEVKKTWYYETILVLPDGSHHSTAARAEDFVQVSADAHALADRLRVRCVPPVPQRILRGGADPDYAPAGEEGRQYLRLFALTWFWVAVLYAGIACLVYISR